MKTVQHHCPTLRADLAAEEDLEGSFAFFRGIPYASVSQRWTQSHIQNILPSTFDATKYGLGCPQPPHKSMITVRSASPVVEADEFACLNLKHYCSTRSFTKSRARDSEISTSCYGLCSWVCSVSFLSIISYTLFNVHKAELSRMGPIPMLDITLSYFRLLPKNTAIPLSWSKCSTV
jgi:hypothetical protein